MYRESDNTVAVCRHCEIDVDEQDDGLYCRVCYKRIGYSEVIYRPASEQERKSHYRYKAFREDWKSDKTDATRFLTENAWKCDETGTLISNEALYAKYASEKQGLGPLLSESDFSELRWIVMR